MDLDEPVRACWIKSTQVKDLGHVASNLDKLMKSLHTWSQVHIAYLPKNLRVARKTLNFLFKRSESEAIGEIKKILVEI